MSAQAQSTSGRKNSRTIYDASPREIFFRNLLAGVSYGLGQVLISLLILSGVLLLAVQIFGPVVAPYLEMYQQSVESLQRVQRWLPGGSPTP